MKFEDMKKILTSVVVSLLFLCTMQAQNNILNSDFELWSYGKPVGWTVGLHGTITSFVNLPVEVNFGTQSSEAHGGSSAVKLMSADFTIPYVGYSLNLPGILQVGESEGFTIPLEDIMNIANMFQDTTGFGGLDSTDLSSLSSLTRLLSNGVPCTQVPASVTAWVKYQPQENDQLIMLAVAKKEGMPISYNYGSFQTDDPNAYQKIGIDLDMPNAECDSIMIVILSSLQLGSSSVLYVDDVSLEYSGVGISDMESYTGKIYPNPAGDRLFIQPENEEVYEWTLTDLKGKLLQSGKASGGVSIDTKTCVPGMYLIQIREQGETSTHKVMITR